MRFSFREALPLHALALMTPPVRDDFTKHAIMRRASELGQLIAKAFPPTEREGPAGTRCYGMDLEVFTREQFLDELARERRAGYREGHEDGEREARRCVRARLQTHIDNLLGDA